MRRTLIGLSIVITLYSVTFAGDPVRFKLLDESLAFDSIKTHKALWIAMVSSSDDNEAEFQRLLVTFAVQGKVLNLSAGTAITVNGRSNGLVVESTVEGTPGVWLILVKAMNAAGFPSPKLDPDFND